MLSSVILVKTTAKDITDMSPRNRYIFDNIKSESQNTINIILSENYTTKNLNSNLRTYIEFTKQYANEHNSEINGFYIIGLPYDNYINLTIANFLGTPIKNLNISLDQSQLQNLQLNNGNISTFKFLSVPNNFQFNYNFTYIDTNNAIIKRNDTFTMELRVFDVIEMNMISKNENRRYYEIN